MLTTINILWQVFFATVAYGIATSIIFMFTCMDDVIAMSLSGRCYKSLIGALFWQMLLPSGRWKQNSKQISPVIEKNTFIQTQGMLLHILGEVGIVPTVLETCRWICKYLQYRHV